MFQNLSLTDLLQKESEDTFVGRDDLIRTFNQELDAIQLENYRVLLYYGVGGIGKTFLRKKLVSKVETESPETIVGVLNFETKEHQKPEIALVKLRTTIGRKYRVNFAFFDIAYTLYMKKTNPSMSLQQVAAPFLDEGDFLASLYDVIEDVPAVGLIPKIYNLFLKGSKIVKDMLTKQKIDYLEALSKMDESKLLKYLPKIFAEDLQGHMKKNRSKAVFFLDTYEILWEDKRLQGYHFKVDEWIRSWIQVTPGVLWVILGREELRWGELDKRWNSVIKPVPLLPMGDTEIETILFNAGILDNGTQDKIIEISEGHPYSVELLIDIYEKISLEKIPEPSDFEWEHTSQSLFSRFIYYLTTSEIKALELLSITRSWDEELFKLLMTEFDTGYPTSLFHELLTYSFITPNEEKKAYEMHAIMRRSLRDHQLPSEFSKRNDFVFTYYAKKLQEIGVDGSFGKSLSYFEEAFFHGLTVVESKMERLDSFVEWFRNEDSRFFNSGKWKDTIFLLEQLIKFLEKQNTRHAQTHLGVIIYDLAYIYFRQGQYTDSLPLFQESFDIHVGLYGKENHHTAKSLYGLGTIYHNMGDYKKAEPLYLESLEIRERVLGPNHLGVAFSVNNLATLYQDMGELEKAEPLYLRSVQIAEELTPPNMGRVALAYLNLVYFYHSKKEYEEALEHGLFVLSLNEERVGVYHVDYGQACNHLANIYFRLGELETAKRYYDHARLVYEKELGEGHVILAKVLHNLGVWCFINGHHQEAKELLKVALDCKTIFYGEEHFSTKSTFSLIELVHQEVDVDITTISLDF
ncbi:tetratricopeptide repeat protein [Fredinandcohnia humi]